MCSEFYSLLSRVQTEPGVHSVSYPMATSRDFSGVIRPAREGDQLPPFIIEVKNSGAIAPFPHIVME
jgi:hypothetical protein